MNSRLCSNGATVRRHGGSAVAAICHRFSLRPVERGWRNHHDISKMSVRSQRVLLRPQWRSRGWAGENKNCCGQRENIKWLWEDESETGATVPIWMASLRQFYFQAKLRAGRIISHTNTRTQTRMYAPEMNREHLLLFRSEQLSNAFVLLLVSQDCFASQLHSLAFYILCYSFFFFNYWKNNNKKTKQQHKIAWMN